MQVQLGFWQAADKGFDLGHSISLVGSTGAESVAISLAN
jgi:hypothetical protein